MHGDRPDNVVARVSEEHGDVDAAFAAAEHIFEWRFEIERSAATPLEGRAVVARFDQEGALLVHDSTQAPTGIRGGLSRLFDIDLDKVQVVAPDVGGGFGVKVIQFYPEEVLVPLAAHRLGMPVKWTEDRREHFVGSTHERKQIHHVRVGANGDGRIVALETSFLHDSGAYCPYGLIIPIITAAQLPGPYRLDNYRFDFTALFTNMVPTSPYRGAGPPARGVRDGARHGPSGARAGARPGRDPPPELHPARRVPLRRRRLVPGRRADGLRLRRLPGRPRAAPRARSATRTSRRGARRRAAEGRKIGLGIAAYVEGTGHRSRTRARRSTSRSTGP